MKNRIEFLLLSAVATASVVLPEARACWWEYGPAFPDGARTGAAGVNQNGTLVAVGGRPFVGEGAAVHFLPPGESEWQFGPPLGNVIMHPGVGIDTLGRIIVFGGYVIEDHFPFFFPRTDGFVYDLADGTGDGIANMHFARAWFGFATDAEHRLYAVGGLDVNREPTDFVERYDALTDTWTVLAPLPEPRDHAAAVYDGNGHILVIGGADAGGSPSAAVFSYDIATEAWSAAASQPTALESQAAVLGANGCVYVLGGSSGGSETDSAYIYDPTAGEWSTGPSLNTARSGAAVALSDDGLIYAMGGYAGSLGTDTVERLDTRAPDPADDCNANGIADECDIAYGTSADTNGNGIPDECECPGDLDGDGDTDHADLGILLADWGCVGSEPGDCPGDLDGDFDTDHSDLGILLADWGCGT